MTRVATRARSGRPPVLVAEEHQHTIDHLKHTLQPSTPAVPPTVEWQPAAVGSSEILSRLVWSARRLAGPCSGAVEPSFRLTACLRATTPSCLLPPTSTLMASHLWHLVARSAAISLPLFSRCPSSHLLCAPLHLVLTACSATPSVLFTFPLSFPLSWLRPPYCLNLFQTPSFSLLLHFFNQ